MTGQQQIDAFGVCAYAHEGEVMFETCDGLGAVALSPKDARRFMFWLARAHQDALYYARQREREGATTTSAKSDHDARYREIREAQAVA